jgi:hypothetical protein
LQYLKLNRAHAINGGLIGVPKTHYKFWEIYRQHCEFFHARLPEINSCDQQILNELYHNWSGDFALTDLEDTGFPTRGITGKLMNHYIGAYMPDKHEVMQADLDARH